MQGSHPREGWEKAAVSQKQRLLRNNAARPGIYGMPVIRSASMGLAASVTWGHEQRHTARVRQDRPGNPRGRCVGPRPAFASWAAAQRSAQACRSASSYGRFPRSRLCQARQATEVTERGGATASSAAAANAFDHTIYLRVFLVQCLLKRCRCRNICRLGLMVPDGSRPGSGRGFAAGLHPAGGRCRSNSVFGRL